MLSAQEIPTLVKHVALAIMAKRPSPYPVKNAIVGEVVGKANEHFIQCVIMAVNALTKQGYLAMGSTVGPGGRIQLTGKGVLLDRQHELEGIAKAARFDHMYSVAASTAQNTMDKIPSRTEIEHTAKVMARTARSLGDRVRGSITKTAMSKPPPNPEQKKPKTLGTAAKAKVVHAKRPIAVPKAKIPTAKKAVPRRAPVRTRGRGR